MDIYGYMEIRLNELLQQKGLSKNKLSHKAEMNWKQIDNYCTNKLLGWMCMYCANCVLC